MSADRAVHTVTTSSTPCTRAKPVVKDKTREQRSREVVARRDLVELAPDHAQITSPSPTASVSSGKIRTKRKRSSSSGSLACLKRTKGMCQHKTYLFALCGHTATLQDAGRATLKIADHGTPSDSGEGFLEQYLVTQEEEDDDDSLDQRPFKHRGMLHQHPLRTYSIPYMCLTCRRAAAQRLASFEAKTIVHNIDTYVFAPSPRMQHRRKQSTESIATNFRVSKRQMSDKKPDETGRNIADRAPAPGMTIPLKLSNVFAPLGDHPEAIAISGDATPHLPDPTNNNTQRFSPHLQALPTSSSISWWQRVTGTTHGTTETPKASSLTSVCASPSLQARSNQDRSSTVVEGSGVSDRPRADSSHQRDLDLPDSRMTPKIKIDHKGARNGLGVPVSVQRDALGRNMKGIDQILGWTAGKTSTLPVKETTVTYGVEELEKQGIVVREIL